MLRNVVVPRSELLGIQDDPSEIFTQWLKEPDTLGDWLELGDSCSLKHAKEGGTAVIQIQHDDLESEELQSMLEAGKQCCRIGLVHEDAEFAITAKLGLRRFTLSEDCKAEAGDEGSDIPAELAVTVRVVRHILAALEPLLGGWPTHWGVMQLSSRIARWSSVRSKFISTTRSCHRRRGKGESGQARALH